MRRPSTAAKLSVEIVVIHVATQPRGGSMFVVLGRPIGLGVARGVAVAATVAVALMTTFALSWGAAVSRAADYQDANHNVCEGTFTSPGCSTWGRTSPAARTWQWATR
jgi:hypothetical protein